MKICSLLIAGLTLATALHGQVPHTLSYQGHLAVNGNGFNSPGQFKFALVDETGTSTLWSNDGTSVGGGEPVDAVTVNVTQGYYSVLLGDSAMANMTEIPHSVFGHPDVHLRIWFEDGQNGFQQLAPDQLISAVGYAMMAADVPDGAITTTKLANDAIDGSKIADGAITTAALAPNSVNSGHIIDGEVHTVDLANSAVTSPKIAAGAVTTAKLADSAVTSIKLANSIDLGNPTATGAMRVWNSVAGVPAIGLNGGLHRLSTFGPDGLERVRLHGSSFGELWLRDNIGNTRTVFLTAGNDGALEPQLELDSSEGANRVNLRAGRAGGTLRLYGGEGTLGAVLYGNEGSGVGALSLRDSGGSPRMRLYGGPHGRLGLYNNAGDSRLRLYGGENSGNLWLYNNDGQLNVGLWSWEDQEGVVTVRNRFGNETIYLWGRNSQNNHGGQIGLKKNDGTQTITLNADHNGEGRITTQVLQITGGSDLSEQFDINAANHTLEAGMVVSIDPENPGQLRLSTQAYDPTVAGIVSGAGGIQPGMLMGQAGTKADGKHPVALTGRVYCHVDASYGPIRPGDLITTSDTPGHGMKVSDHDIARGAIIGKAMTRLDSGRGLVLVLISLQ
jgi:hypothetical protein